LAALYFLVSPLVQIHRYAPEDASAGGSTINSFTTEASRAQFYASSFFHFVFKQKDTYEKLSTATFSSIYSVFVDVKAVSAAVFNTPSECFLSFAVRSLCL
jgi:hypothetical protein